MSQRISETKGDNTISAMLVRPRHFAFFLPLALYSEQQIVQVTILDTTQSFADSASCRKMCWSIPES
jgi:hypothetical protein